MSAGDGGEREKELVEGENCDVSETKNKHHSVSFFIIIILLLSMCVCVYMCVYVCVFVCL